MRYAPHLLVSLTMLAAFETASAHVVLDDPNGGELLPAGSNYTIQWHVAVQHDTSAWDLEYSTDAGGTWKLIEAGLPAGDITQGAIHTYDWNASDDPSASVRVRVKQDNTGQDYYDTSNANLEIEPLDGGTIYDAFCVQCHGANGDPCTSSAGCGGVDAPPDWSQGKSLIDANGNSTPGENEDLYLVTKFGAGAYGGNPTMEEWESFLSDPALHAVADHVEFTYVPELSGNMGLAAGAIFLLCVGSSRRARSSGASRPTQ